jgi:hypothetical protein
MRPKLITLPELFMIAGTRAALGAGVGLMIADRLSREQRHAIGWTLIGIGAVSTIPLAIEVLHKREEFEPSQELETAGI